MRIADNQIGDAGVEALARNLPPSLATLSLDGTCLRFFAIALGRHNELRGHTAQHSHNAPFVRSAGNRIGTAGACVLFESLTVRPMPHPLAL